MKDPDAYELLNKYFNVIGCNFNDKSYVIMYVVNKMVVQETVLTSSYECSYLSIGSYLCMLFTLAKT